MREESAGDPKGGGEVNVKEQRMWMRAANEMVAECVWHAEAGVWHHIGFHITVRDGKAYVDDVKMVESEKLKAGK